MKKYFNYKKKKRVLVFLKFMRILGLFLRLGGNIMKKIEIFDTTLRDGEQ